MKNTSFVLLAKTKKSNVEATKFICSETKQAIFTNVSEEPISPFTGASFLKKTARKTFLDKEDLASYKEVATCPSCKTVWAASKDFIEENSHFNCVVCNESLTVAEYEEEPKEAVVEDITINENQDTVAPMEYKEGAETSEEPNEVIQELVEEVIETIKEESEEEITKEEIKEVIEETVDEVLEGTEAEETEESTSEESAEPSEEICAAEVEDLVITIETNDPESVVIVPEEVESIELPEELTEQLEEQAINEQGFDIPEKIYTSNLTYNLANLLTKEEYRDKVEFIASTINKENPSFYIAVNSIPVAVAEFKKASEAVQAMFSDHDLVLRSLQVTLSNSNKEESNLCLKDFGIRPIVVPVISNKAAIANNVAKAVRDAQAVFKKKEAEMFNVWRESFSTATLMYCKNLQKKSADGKSKSLITKASITETLKSAGVTNADMIVEEAFKRGIQRDYGVIVLEALSLYSKTPEARKEVRDFVTDADYQGTATLASIQATDSEQSKIVTDVKHQSVSSASDDIGNALAFLKGSIQSRRC